MSDKSISVDQWVEDTRATNQDYHMISDDILPALREYVAQERRAAAEAMRDRAAMHFEYYKKNHYSGYLTNEDIAYHAPEIAEMIRSLPLDTPDDERG